MKTLGFIAMLILIAFMIIAAATVYCCIRVGSQSELERPDLIQLKRGGN